jgi:hypothetical protein
MDIFPNVNSMKESEPDERFVQEIPFDEQKSIAMKEALKVKKSLDILCVNEPNNELVAEDYQLRGVINNLKPDIQRITVGTNERVFVDNPKHGFQISNLHSNKKMSARQVAKEMILNTNISSSMLHTLQDKRITHKFTGIIYPLIVPIDTDDEKLLYAGKRRYGKDIITINGRKFFLTNDIYIRNLEPLSKLLAKLAESDENLDI